MKNRTSIILLIHSLFWMFYIVVLFVFDCPYYWDLNVEWYEKIDFELLLLVVSITYFNDQIFLPYFFKKKRYTLYSAIIIGLLVLVTILYCQYTCDTDLVSCFSNDFWIIVIPVVFLSFIWLVLQFFDKQKELEIAHKDRLEIELKFLKSQELNIQQMKSRI